MKCQHGTSFHVIKHTRNTSRDDSNVNTSQSLLLSIFGLLSLAGEVALGGNMTGDFLLLCQLYPFVKFHFLALTAMEEM